MDVQWGSITNEFPLPKTISSWLRDNLITHWTDSDLSLRICQSLSVVGTTRNVTSRVAMLFSFFPDFLHFTLHLANPTLFSTHMWLKSSPYNQYNYTHLYSRLPLNGMITIFYKFAVADMYMSQYLKNVQREFGGARPQLRLISLNRFKVLIIRLTVLFSLVTREYNLKIEYMPYYSAF